MASDSTDWLYAGLTSSFPDLTQDLLSVSEARKSKDDVARPGCRIFQISKDSRDAALVEPTKGIDSEGDEAHNSLLETQVLVFQYRGKFHAMENRCPHSSYPLSSGTAFDIEDFGVVLSAGITCPQHSWSFDLFTGRADRSGYLLRLWEVQLRDVEGERPRQDDGTTGRMEADETMQESGSRPEKRMTQTVQESGSRLGKRMTQETIQEVWIRKT